MRYPVCDKCGETLVTPKHNCGKANGVNAVLADVRAIADKYGRWERVRKGGKVVPHIVISKRSFDKMLRELSEHFR